MTTEEKNRRAEISRANGRKSRGPLTPAGKYRSSMNAIATGLHIELHAEDLPPFFHLLSTDDRAAYLRLFQSHLRKFKPDSEFELALIRRMAVEMFQFDRQTSLATLTVQLELDAVLREHPSLNLVEQFLQGHKRAAAQKDLLRSIERQKKSHVTAYQSLLKTLTHSRKLFPMQPPEPVDISADTATLDHPVPAPEVVAELLALADKAKKEPSFVLPLYVVNFLKDKELLAKVAPHYDLGNLFAEQPPIAA